MNGGTKIEHLDELADKPSDGDTSGGSLEGKEPSVDATKGLPSEEPSHKVTKKRPGDSSGSPAKEKLSVDSSNGNKCSAAATNGKLNNLSDGNTSGLPKKEKLSVDASNGLQESSDDAINQSSAGAANNQVKPSEQQNVGKVKKPTYRYVREHVHLLDPDDPIFYTWGMRNEIAFNMCLVSLVYAVVAPCFLLRVGGQMLELVWTFSLLTCSYMYLWIISLSETMGKMIVFASISYFALLAFAAAHLITPVIGMTIVYLDMVYTTWMLGYAIAEHRQRTGSEQSARAVVTPDLSREELERRDEWFYYVCFYFGMLSLFVFVRTVWMVVLGRVDMAYSVVEDLSFGTWAICFMWSIFVASTLLEGAFASMSIICKIAGYSATLYTLSFLLTAFVGITVGMLVLLFFPMATVGFFGYSVAVHARYKLRETASSSSST